MQEITIDKTNAPTTESDMESAPAIVHQYVNLAKKIQEHNIQVEIAAQPVLELTKESFLAYVDQCVDIKEQAVPDAQPVPVPANVLPLITETLEVLWDKHTSVVGARHVAGFRHPIQPTVDMFVFEVFDAKSTGALSLNLICNSDMSVATDHGAVLLTEEQRASLPEQQVALLAALEDIGFNTYLVRGSTVVVEKVNVEAGCTIGMFFSEIAREDAALEHTSAEYISILMSTGNSMDYKDPEDPDYVPSPSTRLWHESTVGFLNAVDELMDGPIHFSGAAGYIQIKDTPESDENPGARVMVQDSEKMLGLLTTTGDFLSNHELKGTTEITYDEYLEKACLMTVRAAEYITGDNAQEPERCTAFTEYDKGLVSYSAYWYDSENVLEVCLKEVKPIAEEVMEAYIAARQAEEEAFLKENPDPDYANQHMVGLEGEDEVLPTSTVDSTNPPSEEQV